MSEKKTETLNALRDTLCFHAAMGIDGYPVTDDVQQFLQSAGRCGTGTAKEKNILTGRKLVSAGIESLADEISACTLCQLSDEAHGKIFGKGMVGSRLMIVGDWSSQSDIFDEETLFGQEEDVMLWKMMTAIGQQADQVYVTNILKCCPLDSGRIDTKCEETCFSFLAREIAAVNPKVICAMGEMALRILMATKEPLARLRGKIGRYRYPSGDTVMVMPTFHPRFLLQHHEMKKATWNDLLAIKRFLDDS